MKKISIIIPVYNSKKYIERCVRSITKQTYENLEIILVDDGSKDNSFNICKALAEADKRIILIHQENSGVQAARDVGIKTATGDYISFVDSDDWLDENTIEHLYKLVTSGDYQLSACDIYTTDTEEPVKNTEDEKLVTLDFEGMVRHIYDYKLWSLCGKLYEKSLFDNTPEFDVRLSVSEDMMLNHFLYKQCRKIIITDKKFYYYFRHPDSAIGRKINSRRILDSQRAYQIIAEDMDKASRAYVYHIANTIGNDFMLLNETVKHNSCKECRKPLIDEIKKYKKFVFMNENSYCFKRRHKLSVLLLIMCPPLYYIMIKLFR